MHWSEIIADRIIKRNPDKEEYVCAAGVSPSGSVHIGNFRDFATPLFVVKALQKLGKKAKLAYKVLQELSLEGQSYSELEIKLYTGRHHQIRVQLSHAGHPILGDTKYGSEASKALSAQIGKGLKLCAYRLTLAHPKTGEKMTFTAPQVF